MLTPTVASAADEADDASSTQDEDKWIDRWPPTRNMVELGVFGGLALPSPKLELFQADLGLPDQGFKPLARAAGDFGARAAFFPLRFLGAEIEGAVIPARTDADRDRALLWAFRGHVIAQLPLWSVTPFVLAGPSVLGVSSARSALGKDVDLGMHFGAGVKIYINRFIALRFDVRDTLTAKRGVSDGVGNTIELLAGISITLNRSQAKRPRDRDKDGILDRDDECVDVPGVPENQGCPLGDRDNDGILDVDDTCPDTPGVEEYDGCPIPDTDGDGLLDPDDQCVEEPESDNGYQDSDGCPDEVPDELKDFTGVIEGIFFDTNKETIKASSRKELDHAVDVLTRFPTVRVEISGHTDDRGSDEYNMDLSTRRADAVRAYLVDRGVESDRLSARGVGEESPRATNETSAGRAKNRRIEFKLLSN
ncbi:MAG: OmpA family protein [Nannocystaceae bacterium]|nr:OmpA family protein [Nannocystaceae bacterium]